MELTELPSHRASCEKGEVLAIRSQLRDRLRTLGGSEFFRFFWRSKEELAWRELPLSLTVGSLWERITWRWPPENIIKLRCDLRGIDLVYYTEDGFAGPEPDISRARFDFEIRKWDAWKVMTWYWEEYGSAWNPQKQLTKEEKVLLSDPLFRPATLSPEQQDWLDRTYGLGLPRFPYRFFFF